MACWPSAECRKISAAGPSSVVRAGRSRTSCPPSTASKTISTIELHFDPIQGCFIGQPEGSDTTITLAPQGLNKTQLMGELAGQLALPTYQLALPFTHETWRQLEYARTLAATTS